MRFADVERDCNHSFLLEKALTVCQESGKRIVDDELFWEMLLQNENSRQFLKKFYINTLEQLIEDYNEWYKENAFIDHYHYGDERIIYYCD